MTIRKKPAILIILAILLSFSACANHKTDPLTADNTSEKGSDAAPYGESSVSESALPETLPALTSSENETSEMTDIFSERAANAAEPTTISEYGFTPLPSVTLKATDPNNTRKIPTTRIEHSYGVAKDGMPHSISVNNQNFFDSKGYKALAYDKKSQSKVLYLTFDCGWENGYTSKVLDVLREKKVPAAFFCTLDHLEAEPELIARMIRDGHVVGNHSDSHADFSKLTRTQMAQEIESCDNFLRENFGYTSKFFRFPEGSYSENALDLVQSIGFVSVFWSCSYADWDVNSARGANYAFETVTSRLHPGAVILLHAVSPDNAGAMADIIDFARAQGYEFRALDSYNF